MIRRCKCGKPIYTLSKRCFKCEEKAFHREKFIEKCISRLLFIVVGVIIGYAWCWHQFN